MTLVTPSSVDPRTARFATDIHPRLEPFNRAGILGPADVHAARALGRLVGEDDPDVLLATALAVRAPRHSHVCIELGTVHQTVVADDQSGPAPEELDWPEPRGWLERLSASPLVRVRPTGTPPVDPREDRPLTLVGQRLYLDRYWRYERRVAEVLRRRAGRIRPDVDMAAVRDGLDRLLPAGEERPDRQRLAVASALLRSLTVVAGGPGTGKTFTVARLLALVHELAGDRIPRVALVAPTGKAADRLTDALRGAAAEVDTSPAVRQRLRALEASTIHRLLGWSPDPTRFRHDQRHQLPHELVVVDETSMVDLPLMAKLLSALRTSATLVLVGDPDQLASVEAGAVLADVVGPAGSERELRFGAEARASLAAATGEPLDDVLTGQRDGIDDAVVTLGAARRYRHGSGIGQLATAIHDGDPDAVLAVLRGGHEDLRWVELSGDHDPIATEQAGFRDLRASIVEVHRDVLAAATAGDATGALDALDRIRVLCAHRHGPSGVSSWVPLVERWLEHDIRGYDTAPRWYLGRPLLVTHNEPRLHLFNGDVGVVVHDGDGIAAAAFRGPDGVRRFGPSRIEHVETVHAMTIHKSQGSEFDGVAVVLPPQESPVLTRELLYTAVTRARRTVTVLGSEAVIRAAVDRPISRAAGLREALWGSA